MFCLFSRRNLSSSSHNLKTPDGRIVTCPVLRKYVCNLCGACGDNAHTVRFDVTEISGYFRCLASMRNISRYCPLNKDGVFSRGASLPQLKTRRNAAGNFSNRRFSKVMQFCCLKHNKPGKFMEHHARYEHLLSKRLICPPLHSALREETVLSQVL